MYGHRRNARGSWHRARGVHRRQRRDGQLLLLTCVLAASCVWTVSAILPRVFAVPLAIARDGNSAGGMAADFAREQKRVARDMEREAAKQAKESQREAERQARDAEREAAKLAKESQRAAEQQARDAEREAAKLAKESQRTAEQQARDAEREAAKQAKESQREAERQARDAAKQEKASQRETRIQPATTGTSSGSSYGGSGSAKSGSDGSVVSNGTRSTSGSGGSTSTSSGSAGISPSATGVSSSATGVSPSTAGVSSSATGLSPSTAGVSPSTTGVSSSPAVTTTGSTGATLAGTSESNDATDASDTAVTADESGDAGASDAGTSETSVSALPPTTIEKWFSDLVKPNKKAMTVPAKHTKAKDKAPRPPSVDGSVALDMPEFARPEILAVNATPAVLARAKALGFRTNGPASFASLDLSVTPLLAPEGMSTADAQALLSKEVPQAGIAVNQSYRIYRPAIGTGAGTRQAAAPIAAPGSTVPCGIDHCFGRDVVGWRPELRGCVAGLKIGIVDTSVDVKHPALVHKKIEVRHLGPDGEPGPDMHGTGVTALLAGDTASGTPGLIPEASFYVADVFRADADGEPVSDSLSMLRALDWLEVRNVRLINMSLSGPRDVLVGEAIKKLSAKGVIFVAAAGNEGPAAGPSFPAAYDEVIAVTAVGQNLKNYRYANRGSYIDVAAPGVAIWTAMPGSKEGYHSGTSFAAPFVTAALAAIYPGLPATSPAAVLKALTYRDLGTPGPDAIYGQGLLMAPASCTQAKIAATPAAPRPANQASAMGVTGGVSSRRSADAPPETLPWQAEVLPWLSSQNGNN